MSGEGPCTFLAELFSLRLHLGNSSSQLVNFCQCRIWHWRGRRLRGPWGRCSHHIFAQSGQPHLSGVQILLFCCPLLLHPRQTIARTLDESLTLFDLNRQRPLLGCLAGFLECWSQPPGFYWLAVAQNFDGALQPLHLGASCCQNLLGIGGPCALPTLPSPLHLRFQRRQNWPLATLLPPWRRRPPLLPWPLHRLWTRPTNDLIPSCGSLERTPSFARHYTTSYKENKRDWLEWTTHCVTPSLSMKTSVSPTVMSITWGGVLGTGTDSALRGRKRPGQIASSSLEDSGPGLDASPTLIPRNPYLDCRFTS